ncbi:pyridoxal phosphate-dependent aminotransferase [Prosthecodimorpha staleyi]|uniref:aspartate transaminase n=1 Tax=Prosthecodimorpha staleyi TaxID=2840188 RepID=A0A947GEW9_9HYPH|nr:pyridoxal phosphate-dependent aminotransferase [Prosthecodimorpha staleyi]MBT9292011.1 pyridoxal phosphate-dependent aminotransferase [Prosthecodimorpha staleyi]
MPLDFRSAIRSEARQAPESGIVGVFNYGRHREGLIPLWVGEGDLPTPDFICAAADRSLKVGETFYTYQRGIPDLRAALARYHARHYGIADDPERFFVVGSGMQAIQIAVAMVAGHGDEVIVPTPAWPNSAAAVEVHGAKAVDVVMTLGNDGWTLDLDRLEAAVTPRTRALFVNSPSNPTGWTASLADLTAILALARRHGLWIVSDEVYGRFVYDGAVRAPSFHDVAAPEDRILYVNTFSKNWAMTGWRIGWIEADPSLGQVIENLVQYSTSGVPTFVQRAAVVALDEGEDFVARQIARADLGRRTVVDGLGGTGRVRFARPTGAFYLYLAVDGEPDDQALAYRLVDEVAVGLAPGRAFGAGGEGYLRLCFARSPDAIAEATERLMRWLRKGG